jgi:hypothetical protein
MKSTVVQLPSPPKVRPPISLFGFGEQSFRLNNSIPFVLESIVLEFLLEILPGSGLFIVSPLELRFNSLFY